MFLKEFIVYCIWDYMIKTHIQSNGEILQDYVKHIWLLISIIFNLTVYALKTILPVCSVDSTIVNTRDTEVNKAFVFMYLPFYWPILEFSSILSPVNTVFKEFNTILCSPGVKMRLEQFQSLVVFS